MTEETEINDVQAEIACEGPLVDTDNAQVLVGPVPDWPGVAEVLEDKAVTINVSTGDGMARLGLTEEQARRFLGALSMEVDA